MPSEAARRERWLEEGAALHRAGELEAAEQLYRRVLREAPGSSRALSMLAVLRHERGDGAEALALAAAATDSDPRSAAAHYNRGSIALARGNLDTAAACLAAAVRLQPGFAAACNNLGICLTRLHRAPEALEAFDRAVALAPGVAAHHANRARPLEALGRLADALSACETAIALAPKDAASWYNLGRARAACGDPHGAVAAFEQAVAQQPSRADAWDNLLLARHYVTDDPVALAADRRRWRESMDRPAAPPPAASARARARSGGVLRIAYLSPDFRAHSVAWFFAPVLQAHDRSRVAVTCCSEWRGEGDAATHRIRSLADSWIETGGRSDAEVASTLRDLGIDAIIDLAGHTEGNRLGVLALRPAKLQATWLGYPDRTGLAAIDLRLTDAVADPASPDEGAGDELLLRLPRCFLAWSPPETLPVSARPPSAPLAFGSFNALAKLSDRTIALWSQVLVACPTSRLVLKAPGLDDAKVAARVVQRFAAAGVAPARTDLIGRTARHDEHLARYASVDIALDTHPYAGTTTTVESLWMGVPVVTRAGASHASRVGASILGAVGLADLVGADDAGFVSIAAGLAADAARRRALRAQLRDRMLGSPLMDAPALARAIEDVVIARCRAVA